MQTVDYKQHNIKSYVDIAEEYYENNSKSTPKYLRDMLKSLPEQLKILDIGCGPGNITKFLLSLNPKLIVGIDNSPQMIALAKAKNPSELVKFIEIDYSKYKATEKFDLLIAHLSFVHLPPEGLPEMLEKVKSNMEIGAWFFANFFTGDENEFKLVGPDTNKGYHYNSRYFGFYNTEYIINCFNKSGLKIKIKNFHKGHHFNRFNILAKFES